MCTRAVERAALLRWAGLAAIAGALAFAGAWFAASIDPAGWHRDASAVEVLWFALVVVYVLAMALPFVPGIEIGLALMLLGGDGSVLWVWLATQCALALSFACGRWVPPPLLERAMQWLRPGRSPRLLACLHAPEANERMQCLCGARRGGWERLLQHRYLALAVALNLPGNSVAGGAGGLGLIAGASRLFSYPRYGLWMAAATSPLPLLLMLRNIT